MLREEQNKKLVKLLLKNKIYSITNIKPKNTCIPFYSMRTGLTTSLGKLKCELWMHRYCTLIFGVLHRKILFLFIFYSFMKVGAARRSVG